MSASDTAACLEILKRGSKSFYVASRLLPRRLRGPVAVVYAFCRHADDAVDTTRDRAGALGRQRARLERVFGGTPAAAPIERGLSAVVREFRIPRRVFDALLEGFAWDLEGRRYETLEDLYDYCARVASTVGVMMTLLMGPRDSGTLYRACDLGLAMQLTNIARDVGEDAADGRLYLPRRWLREAGIDPDAWLLSPRFEPALGNVVARLLAVAESLYRRADRGIARLPRDCRWSIRAARLIYAEIGRALRGQGHNSIASRAYTSGGRKVWLALRAVPSLGWRGAAHEPELAIESVRFLVEAAAE